MSRPYQGAEHHRRGERLYPATYSATGMRDQSRLIIRADSCITANC
jgi:hypothetical protein